MAQEVAHRQVFRSRDAYLAGVCAGIADRFDVDPIVIRILAVLLAAVTFGLAVVVYIFMWVYIPRAPETSDLYDVTPEYAESTAFGSLDCMTVSDSVPGGKNAGASIVVRLAIAVAIMLLFVVVAINVSPMMAGSSWWQFWPLAPLMGGLCLTIIPLSKNHDFAWHAAGIALMSISATTLPMSLGVVSWETLLFAFEQYWILVVGAVVMYVLGFVRNVNSLMVVGALCFAAFCLIALMFFAIPGDAETLTLLMPDGRELRIAFVT